MRLGQRAKSRDAINADQATLFIGHFQRRTLLIIRLMTGDQIRIDLWAMGYGLSPGNMTASLIGQLAIHEIVWSQSLLPSNFTHADQLDNQQTLDTGHYFCASNR